MKLSKRLERVVAFAAGQPGSTDQKAGDSAGPAAKSPVRIADIGTDHGYVPIALALRDPNVQALALDVRPGPLQRAREHIARYGLEARIETRLSDGAAALKTGEADVIIIAGMGGELILHILEGSRHLWPAADRWILSPQSELAKVRRYLKAQKFTITREDMVEEDGKYYPVMEVVQGEDPGTGQDVSADEELQEVFFLYGPRLIRQKHPVLLRFLKQEEAQLTAIRNRLETQTGEKAVKRREELGRQLLFIARALKEMSSPQEHPYPRKEHSPMHLTDIIARLETLAPPSCACSWDNPGLLAGRWAREVSKIFIALDATDQVVDLAVKEGCDLLLTHHPLIFQPLKTVSDRDFIGRRLLRLIQADISYYSMHTNFDMAPGCMADLAAERLGLIDPVPVEVMGEWPDTKRPYGIGACGSLERPVTLKELADLVKVRFGLPFVTVYGAEQKETISRAAICPGSGKGMGPLALAAGADVLITGDIGHHEGIDSVAMGLPIIDAGHYGLEHIFMDFMEHYIKENINADLTIIKAPVSYPVTAW